MKATTEEPEKIFSEQEYLQQERSGIREENGKYEFHNGKLFFIGGATKEHNTITANLSGLLWYLLKDKDFQLYHSDMRTYVSEINSYFYPDVVITNGEPQFKNDEFDNLINPALIIEVTSPSTADKDRGYKFSAYRTIDSLQEYLILDQDQVLAEHYQKTEENEWKLHIYNEINDTITLLHGNGNLSLKDVYKGVFSVK